MPNVVKIELENGGRQCLADISGVTGVKKGSRVIIDADNCIEMAKVLSNPVDMQTITVELRKISRLATEADCAKAEEYAAKSAEYKQKVKQKVGQYNLDMKLISVTMSIDGKRLLVVYTATERVDFRALVKDLAGMFHTRVEMRQIGEREAASIMGGCGPCGQELCCRRFLGDSSQVSIKMAKLQNMSLNPSKINGVCDKLMCCLQYEYDDYRKVHDALPALGSEITTSFGRGIVVHQDLFRETVAIKFVKDDEECIKEYSLKELAGEDI